MLTPKDFRDIDVDHLLDLARVAEKKAREAAEAKEKAEHPNADEPEQLN